MDMQATDVICAAANAACPGGAGSDFSGNVALQFQLRVTDKRSGPFEGVPATAQSIISFPATCTATPNPSVGGTCAMSTTVDTLSPGFARESRRTIFDLLRIRLIDPGPDGSLGATCPLFCGSGDEAVYLSEALFTP